MSFLGKLDLVHLRATVAFSSKSLLSINATGMEKNSVRLDLSQVLRLLLELGEMRGGRRPTHCVRYARGHHVLRGK
jgi:hypothetical protein